MGTIKNEWGEARTVPGIDGGRRVEKGQEVEVPDDEVFNYTQQSGWSPVGDATTAVHETAAVEQRVAQIQADGGFHGYPAQDADQTEVAAFVVVSDQASVEDVAGKSVEELHDDYATTPELAAGEDPVDEPPAKNAKRDLWAAYAATQGVSAEDLEGKGRGEIQALLAPDEDPVDGPAQAAREAEHDKNVAEQNADEGSGEDPAEDDESPADSNDDTKEA